MKTPPLQARKVEQAIKRSGMEYQFKRAKTNKFNEPVLDKTGASVMEPVKSIKGLFHETGTHFILIASDAAKVQTKPTPAVLAMYKDAEGLQTEDKVEIPQNSGRQYKITSISDIGNLGLFADICLEVVLNGVSV